jgi:hypothetical protein
MVGRIGVCLLLSLGGPQQKEITYGFATEHYVIEMTVGFPKPYVGRRLVFYNSLDPRKELCHSSDDGTPGRCPEQFVGAVAIVRYTVRYWNGRTPGQVTIRERVTVMAQSHGLPDRPSFSKTQDLVNGVGSDIQVFGYDEAGMKKSDRIRTRHQAKQTWRLYRQELYVDSEATPFAIVEWKHAIDRISIVRIYSPADTHC